MAQTQTNGLMQMLDPFDFWKPYRDATLDAWSKPMIDTFNSEEFARFSGLFLDQYLGLAQPVQDAVQRSMTYTLAYLNMPTREEVITLAERLVNIETRLDDLDAKTSDMREDGQAVTKEIRSVDRSLDKVLNTLMTRLDAIEAAIVPAQKGGDEAKPEPKTEPKK